MLHAITKYANQITETARNATSLPFTLYSRVPLEDMPIPRGAMFNSGTLAYIVAMLTTEEFSEMPSSTHKHRIENAWYAVRARANKGSRVTDEELETAYQIIARAKAQ